MTSMDLGIWERAVHKSNTWLKELAGELEWEDTNHVYHALRSTLHALRDRLPAEEAADLGAQLPLLIKGVYYDGWNPAATPVKVRSQADFLALVREPLQRSIPDADPEPVARAVFELLATHVSEGELSDVRHVLPPELRELWPENASAR